MKTMHNERVKLTATFLNGLAVALFAIGGITPLLQMFRSVTTSEWARTLLASVCVCASVILHLAGRTVLWGLEE